MAIQPYQEDNEVSNPVKRIRWATHRAGGTKGDKKRASLIQRLHNRTTSAEKKRESSGTANTAGKESDAPESGSENGSDEQDTGRRVFFNIPLPAEERDQDGHPTASYARNKIRTAKYTPISFVPKNLWFQFHNIANVYFLFTIILGVRPASLLSTATWWLISTLSDILHFWRVQPSAKLRSFDRHYCYNCNQGWYRRLAKDSTRQRTE
jgi:phospholipid-translocating ATPase